jgi:putative sulfotransferase
MLLRHGLVMDEVLFRPRPGGRYSFETGVPALLHTALPHLFDEPEPILDEVRSFVLSRPPASAADHYRALFTWLARRIDRRTWVERSGGSLRIVARLLRAFPDARFVHIVRDGRDAAISMSRHHGFRMALFSAQLTEILGVDPYEVPDRTQEADVPDDLLPYLPERFDPEAFRAADVPLGLCGHYWSGECVAGVGELGRVAPGRVLVIRFEDLLQAPAEVLTGLQGFLDPEFADPEWPARMALRVGRPRSSWRELPPRARRELDEACRAGFEALGGLYPFAESA